LLILNRERQVTACVWYLEHENTTSVERLRARRCALATRDESREQFHTAIDSELARARDAHMKYAEVGGWAVARDCRCTSEGLVLALAAYSLGRIAGGALGLTTATVRHASSTILRRIGGSHLMAGTTPIPAYFDPRYGCEMELLRFDSRRPAPKYSPLIDHLKDKLADVLVVASSALAEPFEYTERPALAPAACAA
jgi:hypothetical protein